MGLLKKIVREIARPIRKVVRAASETAAGLFEDVTEPFLAPIEKVIDALSPRIRIVGELRGGVTATVSGTTTHQIVVPQLPGYSAPSGPLDITGGLLSDLAFDSAQMRRAESDLEFLSSAMRKGVYPHRDDTILVGISTTPLETISADLTLRLTVNGEGDSVLLETVFVIRKDKVLAERRNLLARMRATANDYDTEEMAAGLELGERFQLSTRSGMRGMLRITLTAHSDDGKENPELFKQLQDLAVWAERRNRGYTDVLHRCSCNRPLAALRIVWPLDRYEYASGGPDDRMRALGDERSGGALAAPVASIGRAIAAIRELDRSTSVTAAGTDAAHPLGMLIHERVARAEQVRNELWSAQRSLRRVRGDDGRLDFRMRYKLRVLNPTRQPRRIAVLRFRNVLETGSVGPAEIELKDFDVPADCEYEITIYPLMQDTAMTSRAELELGGTGPHITLSLIQGLGLSESIARCVSAKPLPGASLDSAVLEWQLADCFADPQRAG